MNDIVTAMGFTKFEDEYPVLRQSQDQMSAINENMSLIGSDFNATFQVPAINNMQPPVINISKNPVNKESNPASQTSFSFRLISALAPPQLSLNIEPD